MAIQSVGLDFTEQEGKYGNTDIGTVFRYQGRVWMRVEGKNILPNILGNSEDFLILLRDETGLSHFTVHPGLHPEEKIHVMARDVSISVMEE